MIWFTSDLHLFHDRDFIFSARGFQNVNDMNTTIVHNWNKVVNYDDECYILGDIMLNNNDEGLKLLHQLKGKIHIILGNHDTEVRKQLYIDSYNVVSVSYAEPITYNGYHFFLSHYPCITNNADKELKRCTINLYGHTHQTTNFYENNPLIYHVGVDSHNCCPVNIDTIISEIKTQIARDR